MNWQDRIVSDPKVLTGKPVIKGTRIAVEFVVGLFAEGWSVDELLRNYPQLTLDDLRSALQYAAAAQKPEPPIPA